MDLRGQARQGQRPAGWPGHDDPAWTAVRRWQGMRGEDKLAWAILWVWSRGGRERISTTPAEVAADQGVTADAGRARLKNLAAEGLIRVCSRERATGVWLLEVCDPAELEGGRVVKSDGQKRLFDEQEASGLGQETLSSEADAFENVPTAGVWSLGLVGGTSVHGSTEEPPEVPRRATEDPPEDPRFPVFEGLPNPRARLKPSVFGRSSSSESFPQGVQGDETGRRGTSGGSSAGMAVDEETAALVQLVEMRRQQVVPRQPATERPVVEALRQRVTPEQLPRFGDLHAQQVQDVNRLVGEVSRRVADAKLRQSPVLRVAWAVVEGRLPRERLYRILDRLDKLRQGGELTCPASAYFVVGCKGAFRDLGLDWQDKPR